jgi:chromate transporter
MHVPAPESSRSVFVAFLRLGVTSFGGPIAHLGYMHEAFVVRRRWLTDSQFAQLLAVSQLLPGPASSQLGFAIGWLRAGWQGALAAFVAFTAPSALALLLLARYAAALDRGIGAAVVHGLKLSAVVIVAHGLLRMIRTMTPDLARALIAVLAALIVMQLDTAWGQLGAIAFGALAGWFVCPDQSNVDTTTQSLVISARTSRGAAVLFVTGLALALLWSPSTPTLPAIASAFYRAGALVFGGGHVVLPLLEQSLVDTSWMSAESFMLGYGAAQAVPGPLFSVAAYMGAVSGAHLVWSALAAIVAIFAPGFLLLIAVLPVWTQLRALPRATRVIAGINAAVVGLLAAALYDPVWTSAVHTAPDIVLLLLGWFVLSRTSPIWAVLSTVIGAVLLFLTL